ncbi:MAG: hypothetical protein ABSA53_24310, partial [Streptosporangiaceae bacterium]
PVTVLQPILKTDQMTLVPDRLAHARDPFLYLCIDDHTRLQVYGGVNSIGSPLLSPVIYGTGEGEGTAASQCTRRYAHDLEEQRRIFVGVGWRSPSADRAQIVPFWAIKDSEGRSSGVCLGPSSYQRPYVGTASGVTRPVLSPAWLICR